MVTLYQHTLFAGTSSGRACQICYLYCFTEEAPLLGRWVVALHVLLLALLVCTPYRLLCASNQQSDMISLLLTSCLRLSLN